MGLSCNSSSYSAIAQIKGLWEKEQIWPDTANKADENSERLTNIFRFAEQLGCIGLFWHKEQWLNLFWIGSNVCNHSKQNQICFSSLLHIFIYTLINWLYWLLLPRNCTRSRRHLLNLNQNMGQQKNHNNLILYFHWNLYSLDSLDFRQLSIY